MTPVQKAKHRRYALANLRMNTDTIFECLLEMQSYAGDIIIDPESEQIFNEIDHQLELLGTAAAAVRKAIE